LKMGTLNMNLPTLAVSKWISCVEWQPNPEHNPASLFLVGGNNK